jgi:hypothetical protein
MTEPRAQRTLVKSPPELWAEVSDAGSLARHLGEFGEIRITRLEPETTVVWEGDRASGTVELEGSGWGTKVTLTAVPAGPEPARGDAVTAAPVVAAETPAEPEPVAVAPEPEPAPLEKTGLFARLFGRKKPTVVVEPIAVEPEPIAVEPEPIAVEPEPVAVEPEPEPEPRPVEPDRPEPLDAGRTVAILTSVLDDLGSAHHRPFSRA